MRGQNREHLMSVLAVALFLVWSVFQPQFAMAVAIDCTEETQLPELIEGNLTVPEGESCTMDDVTVTGNVTANGCTGLVITDWYRN